MSLSGPFGPPANPSFQLRLAGGREVLHFTFYPGFGRWNDDVLRLIQGGNRNLREAPDVLMCEVKSGREVAILAIEFSGALSAGNQAWQRSGRAYSSGFSTVPYLYLLEVGGHELDAGRGKKATRLPNPAVPFSYLTFSSASTFPILPVLVPSPGCDPKTRDEFSDAFGFTDLLELLRAVILSTDISGAVKALEGRVLEFVVKISAGSRAGRTLSTVQWREAHQALSEGEEGLVGYLLGQQKIRWSKRRSGKVEITDRVKQLMSLAARYGQGLSSSYLPFCLVAASDRLTLARSILSLYPRLGDDYLEWLRRERPLVVCWITGYKHRGDDSRPDRGLVPFARMLVGEDCDLLSVVYGPGPDQHWRVLEDKPLELAHNGLWEAIMATSDAILVDPVNGGIARHGYLRRHWDTVEDPPEVRSMFVWPLPTSFGEQDVDTVIHLLFARLRAYPNNPAALRAVRAQGGEVKEGDVVVGRLIPADQDAPEAVQPAVRAFHHPAPGFEPSFSFDGLGLLAPAADVSGEAKLVQRASHLVKVVAFIQAHTLGLVGGLGAGRGTGRLSTVARTSFMS